MDGAANIEPEWDWIIVGSGFGGSVSALRLAEKGYSVLLLERGRRFEDNDFAESTWQLSRYFWAPLFGLRGILKLTLFRDIFIGTGSGVGGGSLGYANTLYRAHSDNFFDDPQWRDLADWRRELDPHYDTAEHMLGVTEYPYVGDADTIMRDLAKELDVEDTWKPTRVGVFFGEDGVEVPDPYFGGAGPPRAGCKRCGSCMVGCRNNAKNTLPKNYLWFAEKSGARIMPEREATVIRPLGGSADGASGYEVVTQRPGAWFRRQEKTFRARNVMISAGALGTTSLLHKCRIEGHLPNLSDRVGWLVRTNSEAILAATATDDERDFTKSVAISSSIFPDDHTHIEPVTYGEGGGAMNILFTLLTGGGTRLTRPFKFFGQVLRHPIRLAKITWPGKWSRRTIIVLVMQSHDNSMRLLGRKRLIGRGIKLRTKQEKGKENPTWIPVANWAAQRAAEMIGGIPQSGIMEALFNIPGTAHILGGAPIGDSPVTGVIDAQHRVYGYRNLYVCDGSSISANIGVNPSLTITAMAERAMAFIQPAESVALGAGTASSPVR